MYKKKEIKILKLMVFNEFILFSTLNPVYPMFASMSEVNNVVMDQFSAKESGISSRMSVQILWLTLGVVMFTAAITIC